MKKLVSALLAMIMLFSVWGCDHGEAEDVHLPAVPIAQLVDLPVEDVEPIDINWLNYADKERDFVLTIEDAEVLADGLNKLGIFKGSDKGYELEKPLTRVEGTTLIVRLLAKEDEVQNSNYEHPFKDVPKWAEKNISYMYHKGKTTGIDNEIFGSDRPMSGKDFTTFILRVLNYDDKEGDFTWATSLDKAVEIGLYDREYKQELERREFLRKDAVYIISRALNTPYSPTFVGEGALSTLQTALLYEEILDVEVMKKDAYFLSAVERVKDRLVENKKFNRLWVKASDFAVIGDTLYGVVENRLYKIDGDKAKPVLNEPVETVYDYEGSLYIISGDYNGKGLYRLGVNNSKSKIKGLDGENLYKILGGYKNRIYYYTITEDNYGIGDLYGDVFSVDLESKEVQKIADNVYMWRCSLHDNMLFYIRHDSSKRASGINKWKSGINVLNLDSGKLEKLFDGFIVGDAIKVDDKIFLDVGGHVYLYDLNNGESKKLYSSKHGHMYAFYDGWLYFEHEKYDRIFLKQNVYTGEVRKIHDGGGNSKVGFYIYDGNIYWVLNESGKKTLFISDLEGNGLRKVGGI